MGAIAQLGPHLMTTSHDDESAEDAVWFLLMCTAPDEACAET